MVRSPRPAHAPSPTRPASIAAFAVLVAPLAFTSVAGAATLIREPSPPRYKVEIEPHLDLQPSGFYDYGGGGFGFGARFSIPVMSPGFIRTINDSVAISFGPDLVRFSGYGYDCLGRGCERFDTGGFWSLYFPVAMQWNFWLTEKWSVFGEPGLAVRHAFITNACDGDRFACRSNDQVFFAFYAGARYHFGDTEALTLRFGHPTLFSIGLSFF